jgi:pimeloyl-ACP methyl ester carboxylesterase
MMRINFYRRGAGSPLVLLHGIGHRWQAWRPVLDRLAERHDVVAVDLPGYGLSPPLPDGIGHDLGGSMRMLGMIFQELGMARPHVAGNSLGGLISVEAASRGMVASATALSPAGFWTNLGKARALAMLRAMRVGALAPTPAHELLLGNARLRAATLSTLYAHPERIDRISVADDMAALRGSTSFNLTMRAGREYSGWQGSPPAVPVTIAWGEKDRILPPRQAQRAAQLLPDAHHVMLPHCGHVPMSDDPDLVAKVILDTCARAEPASPARAEQQARAAAERREQRQAS